MTRLVNESLVEKYSSFFDVNFEGKSINNIFEIQGDRYIIEDIVIKDKNIYSVIVYGIDSQETLELIIDANTNQAIDLNRNDQEVL